MTIVTNKNPFANMKVRFVNATSLAVRGSMGSITNVYEEEKSDGNTLVYYAANNTYVLQSSNNLNITEIDCGEF